jgi:superfamily II DNA or RNA helicase
MNTQDWMKLVIAAIAQPSIQSDDLEKFQREGVVRLVDMTHQFGGAVLADGVGLGKTRMSLHAAARMRRRSGDERPLLICAGARLRNMWEKAAESAGFRQGEVRLLTHTAMSRQRFEAGFSVIIVDEAHHFRNPSTNRYACLEALSHSSQLLLLTATPVVNSVWDLYHLLHLFLADHDTRPWTGMGLRDAFAGAEQGNNDITELLRLFCVRREQVSTGIMKSRPDVALAMLPYEPTPSEKWLWENLEAELRSMHLSLLEGDWPRGLFVDHVLRSWEGGPHSLQRALSHLASFHTRWLELDAQGRRLERSDFGVFFGEGGEQAVLHFMFEKHDTNLHRAQVVEDESRLNMLEAMTRRAMDESGGMNDAVAECVKDGRKCLVFATYQRSAEGLFKRLQGALGPNARVGMITGSTAISTGIGKTKGDDLLCRFAPRAHGVELSSHQELQILICTDCLSEGVNLQDCERMIFLDLPWTPHAIEQRIGRLVRPGSQTDCVQVLLPRPHQWNDTLGMRHRLNSKLKQADATHTGFRSLRPSTTAVNPLEALTLLDRLAARYSLNSQPICPRHVHAIGEAEETWMLFKVTTAGFERHRLVRQKQPKVEERLEHLVPEMIQWIDHPLDVWDQNGPPAEAKLFRKRLWESLQGAACAPVQMETVQLDVWHRLLADGIQRSSDVWASMRAKLLAPLTRGQIARLHALHGASVDVLERQIMAWKEHDEQVTVLIVATLKISPEANASADHP